MKRIGFGLLAVLGAAVFTLSVQADSIVGSKHDLTANTNTVYATDGTGEICAFCHTPHRPEGIAAATLLWNRDTTGGAASWSPYSSATIQGDQTAGPGQGSLECLSCHDGSVALNSLHKNNMNVTTFAGATTLNGTYGGNGYVGTDLSNDHPVGITYDNVADTALNAPAGDDVGSAKLFAGQVECASCHLVHDPVNGFFLRDSNAASNLCLQCHNK